MKTTEHAKNVAAIGTMTEMNWQWKRGFWDSKRYDRGATKASQRQGSDCSSHSTVQEEMMMNSEDGKRSFHLRWAAINKVAEARASYQAVLTRWIDASSAQYRFLS
jgi:hypothetical protein